MDEIEELDNAFGQFERGLNVIGYVPFISMLSGGVRVGFGKLEVIGAVVVSAFMAIKSLFNPDTIKASQELNKAKHIFVRYALHGGGNIIRGALEMIPLLSLVTCLPYDLMGNRFAYVRESSDRPGFYYVHQFGA